jgi:ribosomal protein L12E/L44/L45/RPP1/RPP2
VTQTAQSIVEQVKRLSASELREVCQAVIELAARAAATPSPPSSTGASEPEEADDAANEAAFFAALEELRQRGTVNSNAANIGD